MTFWRNRFLANAREQTDSYDEKQVQKYINRELSWLDFNDRVLTLAGDKKIPLLERCRYLAICSSNLDEFYQIRVAALKDQIAGEVHTPTADGMTPQQQLSEIAKRTQDFVSRQHKMWANELLPKLTQSDVVVFKWSELGETERATLTDEFDRRIFPVLTPLVVDPAHPFPYISNLALNLAVVARDPQSGEQRFARLKIPKNISRFMRVGSGNKFVLLEEVVSANLPRLFRA